MDSLYPTELSSMGKNSPYVYVLPALSLYDITLMCSRIFGTSASYSSFEYCLFKMQYCFCRSATQPNKLLEPLHTIEYSTSCEFSCVKRQKRQFCVPIPQAWHSYISWPLSPQMDQS